MSSRRTRDGDTALTFSRTNARGLWSDLLCFLARRPAEKTRLKLSIPEERANYDRRILERVGASVADNAVLNIHRIGIKAPPDFVWDVWARHDRDAHVWPSSIALPVWENARAEHGKLLLFGLGFLPIFELDLIPRRDAPKSGDPDGARYALYRCSGGYPVGVVSIYTRSRMTEENELERTQFFFMVSFDFFGRKQWLGTRAVRPVWEPIHDRVTTHVLNRFKAHCEEAFANRAPTPEAI